MFVATEATRRAPTRQLAGSQAHTSSRLLQPRHSRRRHPGESVACRGRYYHALGGEFQPFKFGGRDPALEHSQAPNRTCSAEIRRLQPMLLRMVRKMVPVVRIGHQDSSQARVRPSAVLDTRKRQDRASGHAARECGPSVPPRHDHP